MLTIDSPELRSGLDDRKEAYAVAGDVGKRTRDDLRPADARELVEDDEDLQRRGRVGQSAHIEIDELLKQAVVEWGHPIKRSEEHTSELQSLMRNSHADL